MLVNCDHHLSLSLSPSTASDHTAHAETQTQIRGIAIQSAVWQTSRTASTTSNTSDISVATISRLLEQMEGGGEGGGLVTVPAVIFFTESDNRNKRYAEADLRFVQSPMLLKCTTLQAAPSQLGYTQVCPGGACPHLRPPGRRQSTTTSDSS